MVHMYFQMFYTNETLSFQKTITNWKEFKPRSPYMFLLSNSNVLHSELFFLVVVSSLPQRTINYKFHASVFK
jgi:hypothetical protein